MFVILFSPFLYVWKCSELKIKEMYYYDKSADFLVLLFLLNKSEKLLSSCSHFFTSWVWGLALLTVFPSGLINCLKVIGESLFFQFSNALCMFLCISLSPRFVNRWHSKVSKGQRKFPFHSRQPPPLPTGDGLISISYTLPRAFYAYTSKYIIFLSLHKW